MNVLTSAFLALAAAAVVTMFGVALSSIAERISLFLTWLAARVLPAQERARCQEEWSADIHAIETGPQKALYALQIFLASPRIRHTIKSTSRETSPQEVAELRAPRRLILVGLTGLFVGLSVGLVIIALSASKVEIASWVTAAVSAISITIGLAYGSISREKQQEGRKEGDSNGKAK